LDRSDELRSVGSSYLKYLMVEKDSIFRIMDE
jgi:hypothetical protein